MSRPPIHPVDILNDELKEIGISATELARQIKVPQSCLSQIILGKRGITGDTALRLGHWFGNSAQFWLNLQTAYELRLAKQEAGRDQRFAGPLGYAAATGTAGPAMTKERGPCR